MRITYPSVLYTNYIIEISLTPSKKNKFYSKLNISLFDN